MPTHVVFQHLLFRLRPILSFAQCTDRTRGIAPAHHGSRCPDSALPRSRLLHLRTPGPPHLHQLLPPLHVHVGNVGMQDLVFRSRLRLLLTARATMRQPVPRRLFRSHGDHLIYYCRTQFAHRVQPTFTTLTLKHVQLHNLHPLSVAPAVHVLMVLTHHIDPVQWMCQRTTILHRVRPHVVSVSHPGPLRKTRNPIARICAATRVVPEVADVAAEVGLGTDRATPPLPHQHPHVLASQP